MENITLDLLGNLKENISTGEYKAVFNLYSNDGQFIQTDYKTFVVIK